jgi:hypothetical protein
MIVANQMRLVKYHLRVNHHTKIHTFPHAFLVCNTTSEDLESEEREEEKTNDDHTSACVSGPTTATSGGIHPVRMGLQCSTDIQSWSHGDNITY